MRYFNTGGPCQADLHYMIDPLGRIAAARPVVAQRGYFVVHAPRQSGKTTALRAFAQALTAEGPYAALYLSCEGLLALGEDVAAVEAALLDNARLAAGRNLPADSRPPAAWPDSAVGTRIHAAWAAWALACPRPLVLFIDEIDTLGGNALQTVLRQLRAGHADRPRHFPWSIGLCGMRDVRDYKVLSGGDPSRTGSASPFNVLVESLRLASFTPDEVGALYAQHTADTGQPFTDEAVARAWELSGGQPWLVNALAREIVQKMAVPPPVPITAEHVEAARERLILARATHLDSLTARLSEERVRRVIEPVVAGTVGVLDDTYDDDFQYVRDLGLVAPDSPVRIANPIYREVILRVLGAGVERHVTAEPRSFVLPDGRLDLDRLLREFADFWVRHGEVLTSRLTYHEVAPQLVLMAFFQRIVNGGGHVEREVGVGRGRIDLHLRWPYRLPDGSRAVQEAAIELKVWAPGRPDPLPEGLEQLDAYLDRLGFERGTLVIFDRRPEAQPIAERTRFEAAVTPKGRPVTLLRA